MRLRSSVLLYVAALTVLSVWALLPESWESTHPPAGVNALEYNSITFLAPFISEVLFYASVVMASGLLILALLAYRWPVVRLPVLALFLAIIGFPCAGLFQWFSSLAEWEMYGRVSDSNGTSYVFCDTSFLQGQTIALTRVDAENFWFTRVKVLGTNNGDSPRSWASVIRPKGAEDKYGQLYLTSSNMLIGLRYGNRCFLAVDLNNGQFSGHGDIESISPFVCVDADDELHKDDIQAIKREMAEWAPGIPGQPHKEVLEYGLDHPNPSVRQVAKDLLTLIDSSTVTAEGGEPTDGGKPQ